MRRCPRESEGIFMGFIEGEHRNQGTLFPVVLDDLIPADHVCRVIEAFVGRLDMEAMGFVRAEPAETGRPGYDPRDLLKLYLYGYRSQPLLHAIAKSAAAGSSTGRARILINVSLQRKWDSLRPPVKLHI